MRCQAARPWTLARLDLFIRCYLILIFFDLPCFLAQGSSAVTISTLQRFVSFTSFYLSFPEFVPMSVPLITALSWIIKDGVVAIGCLLIATSNHLIPIARYLEILFLLVLSVTSKNNISSLSSVFKVVFKCTM